ncbi:phagosome assembly factor 1-like [Paramacrobiotus metropolitanus]|uniref:phagosome assembly factor 1-like n=1 Tax=Paramacrobiotus metropolitanus TaxID=2943436 RepID=UPI002445F54E|nr:phagosome assembly factor 1-like [Paramacrobiotus metropolitanus]XP_055354861.1 phagosome assembly factor 1-like [Paramacrobiotus metropolitanus]XP_055354868.1 phagosome assembly factor 1-like [Paramacrobiotus metropolitanus]XP_055354874.1 phagosome assembly factor 1-like [Paramacrobiotus metropolitanus]
MLDLEVVPERSLGCDNCEFKLGMPFMQAVQILQKQCRNVSVVDVNYVENDPLSADLVLKLTNDGIRLIFDSQSQRLKIIEVFDMGKVKLKYAGVVFCSPEISPTRSQIDLSFGATRPPEFDNSQQSFILSFRGLSFSFPAVVNKSASAERTNPQFPNLNSVLVSKMSVFSGSCLSEAKVIELPFHCYNGGVYSHSLDVLREDSRTFGVQVHLMFEGIDSSTSPSKLKEAKTICFGNTVQDVLSLLGAPGKIFYKAEDKMKIHAPPEQQLRQSTNRSDYFFNYFTLGLDILFDAVTQRAKKFVLHTNYPGHYDFNIYYRCMFKIPLTKSTPVDGGSQTSLLDQTEPMTVTAFSKWDEIHTYILGPESRPIVLNRISSVNATNPFGPTYCYGYQDMIFEVMPNGHIASITLYQIKE